MSWPVPPGRDDPAVVDRALPPHAITCLLDALRSSQEVIRSYDTKAQIMGIIFILSINFVLTLIRELIGVGPIPAAATVSLAVLVLLPLGLFGYVLFPANNPVGDLDLGGQPVRHSYFVDRRGPGLSDYHGRRQGHRLGHRARFRDHEDGAAARAQAAPAAASTGRGRWQLRVDSRR